MSIYVQTDGELKPFTPPSPELTAEDIEKALGYTPADADNIVIPNIPEFDTEEIESDSEEFVIVDKDDNKIVQIDREGLHVTDVKIGKMVGETLTEKTLTEFVTELIPNNGGGGSSNVDLTDYYKKSETYNRDEVDDKIPSLDGYAKTSDVTALKDEIVSNKDEFHIVDDEDNIVATIDASGVQTTCVTTKEILIAKDDSHLTGVIISDVGKSQGNTTTPILDFVCENAGEDVILRGISSPLAEQDATPKSYVDGKFKNVAAPTADGHAANKKYVDDEIYKFSSGDNSVKNAQTASSLNSGYITKGAYGSEISVNFTTGRAYVILVENYGATYTGIFLCKGGGETLLLNPAGTGNIKCKYNSGTSTITFFDDTTSMSVGACYIREL